MRPSLVAVIFGTLSAAAMPDAAAAPKIQAGQWEVSIAGTVAGVQVPAATQQLCFNDKDIADIQQLLPSGRSCDIKNINISANSGTWSFQCKGELPITGRIALNFGSDSFSGTLALTIAATAAISGDSSDGPTQIDETIQAHRTGSCSN